MQILLAMHACLMGNQQLYIAFTLKYYYYSHIVTKLCHLYNYPQIYFHMQIIVKCKHFN